MSRTANPLGDKFLTAEQIAEALQISVSHLCQCANEGKFPKGFKIGSVRRWTLSSIQNWFNQQERELPPSSQIEINLR